MTVQRTTFFGLHCIERSCTCGVWVRFFLGAPCGGNRSGSCFLRLLRVGGALLFGEQQ